MVHSLRALLQRLQEIRLVFQEQGNRFTERTMAAQQYHYRCMSCGMALIVLVITLRSCQMAVRPVESAEVVLRQFLE